MKTIVLKNKNEVAEEAANIVYNFVKKKPSCVLGLATGETMIPFYRELRKRNVDFTKIKTVNLDEYIGLGEKDRDSYHHFMNKHLFSHVNIRKNNIYFPAQGKSLPKVDLQILGLGVNGHIGFNEPGSDKNSKMRKVILSESTRKANSRFFGLLGKVPKEAYTLGIKEIMQSKKIILLAFGRNKSEAVLKSVKGKISDKVPASFLRNHKDATFIIDKSAASRLNAKA